MRRVAPLGGAFARQRTFLCMSFSVLKRLYSVLDGYQCPA